MKRLLIAGFGDIARRAQPRLERRFAVQPLGRRFGLDLDRPETLALEGAEALLHCAPPPASGEGDLRTAHLLAALEKRRILPARVVYVSTSGVYGDCAGERVDESRPPAPQSARAQRRLDAERQLALWCNARGAALVVLRAPMPELGSFMMESRRLDNRKLKQVLGLRLLYPTVHEGLRHAEAAGVH